MRRPLAVDLFTGLHGWAEGLVAEGWRVRGYDIEDMCAVTGATRPEHIELVIQDVLTLNGADLVDADGVWPDLIVSSSPCTDYSYMAMPWSLAKAKAAAIRADETGEALRKLNALFDAQFRIQREASEAKGEPIPMVVENVKGAQPWVGRSRWNYGSFHLWGDVPAVMPQIVRGRQKSHPGEQWNVNRANYTGTLGWDASERTEEGLKNPGFRFDGSGKSFQTESVRRHQTEGTKVPGMNWSNYGKPDYKAVAFNDEAVRQMVIPEGEKHRDTDGYDRTYENSKPFGWKAPRSSSNSSARKAASAAIAKIPLALSRHIGRVYYPGPAR